MKQNVICIAGAHRSGTSMLARLLHRCGLYLGSEADLMPAAADNPDGFWEHLGFVKLNEEILNAVRSAWDLPPQNKESFNHSNLRPIRAKAELVISEFSQQHTWGWKDPRNCLTLPFWKRQLPGLRVVIIVRNPLEVAYSMHKRNGTSYALGLRLWEIYNRRLVSHAPSEERIVVDYQSFFDHPEAELQRLALFVGLPPSEVGAAAGIITQTRRHTTFTKQQLIDAGVSEEIITLYDSLIVETKEPQLSSEVARKLNLDPSEEEPDPLAGASSELNVGVPEGETIRQELAWRRGAEQEHQEKIVQFQARIESLTQELSAQNTRAALEIGRRDGRITELQVAYAHLDELLLREQAGRDKLLAELRRVEGELTKQSNRDAAELERLQAELTKQSNRDAAELERLQAELTKQSNRDAAEISQLHERFAQTNRLLHTHSIQLAARETESISLSERLRKQLGETRCLVRLLDEVEQASDLLRHSRRWILVNPFAWFVARLSRRPLRGFGHLDRIVNKFKTWRSSHPGPEELESAMTALRSREPTRVPVLGSNKETESQQTAESKPPSPTKPLEFSIHDDVEVSIIIPVFNQVEFTQVCLAAVQENSDNITFEPIVVDDCSTDATQELFKKVPGLVYLRKDINSGFISSCNYGAKHARGRYLLFLNNDTIVTPGWMARLRETFDFEPLAGLVGSKLVYPDGRLQEAGGIIWNDASGWNRGKFQDPGKPEYNFLREVDYCSAASVMISKALFDSVGGFDARYEPAYYEDTDLAFKVADLGRKVLYQPLSVVTHYEGITGGTDTSSGTKRHQEINRETFASTWVERLATKPINGDLAGWERPSSGRQRILVIDHHVPFTDRDSGSLRMFHILTLLHELGHCLTFIPDNLADIPPYGDDLRKRGIELVHHPYVKSVRDYLEANGNQFDTVILSRRDFARKHLDNVRRLAPQAHLIFDTVDLHFLREGREAELMNDTELNEKMEENKRLEYQLIDQADEIWVVSPIEREILHRERPQKLIEVVSNIVPVMESVAPFSLRRDILFIGSFQHPPNIDAVLFFVRQIFPQVREQLPGVCVYIIGDKAPPEIIALADDTIIVTGYQPDVRSYFESIKVSVAPLRYGAGVKGKINQSMGFGVPVVATQVAAEGMGLRPGEDILIEDEPSAFADALVRVLSSEDLWTKLSKNSLKKTNELYSFETARNCLTKIFAKRTTDQSRAHDEPMLAERTSPFQQGSDIEPAAASQRL